MLLIYFGTLLKRVLKSRLFYRFRAEIRFLYRWRYGRELCLNSDCAVNPCTSIAKLIGAFERKTKYEHFDLPLYGLLPQFSSENAANLKPPCLCVIKKSSHPQVLFRHLLPLWHPRSEARAVV